jgi:hypothetical protein
MLTRACKKYKITKKEAEYFVISNSVNNSTYNSNKFKINVLFNDGKLLDVAKASDHLNIQSLSNIVTKYYLCYPKDLI